MSVEMLERLKSEEFALAVGFLATPGAVRRFLRTADEVSAIREALRNGAISEDTLRKFVSVLMRDLRHGERFPHELSLAALAVVLEIHPTNFAEEFLHDLARLQRAEMSLCIRLARECVKHRSVTTNTMKEFPVTASPESASSSIQSFAGHLPKEPRSSHAQHTNNVVCEAV